MLSLHPNPKTDYISRNTKTIQSNLAALPVVLTQLDKSSRSADNLMSPLRATTPCRCRRIVRGVFFILFIAAIASRCIRPSCNSTAATAEVAALQNASFLHALGSRCRLQYASSPHYTSPPRVSTCHSLLQMLIHIRSSCSSSHSSNFSKRATPSRDVVTIIANMPTSLQRVFIYAASLPEWPSAAVPALAHHRPDPDDRYFYNRHKYRATSRFSPPTIRAT